MSFKHIFSVTGVMFISMIFYQPARADNCNNQPCKCGDTVTATRALSGADPITTTVCPLGVTKGLEVINLNPNPAQNPVVLNLGGGTIRGSGGANTVGISIGSDHVRIEDGRVDNFGNGIAGVTSGSTIDSIRAYNNKVNGIALDGDDNDLFSSPARHNGNFGYHIIGDGNFMSGANNEYNGFHGIVVEGNENRLEANLASENAKDGPGNGIWVIGDGNTLEGNRMTKKNSVGIVVDGNDNRLTANQVTKQSGDGFVITGDHNVLKNNKSTDNRGDIGIEVVGVGTASDSSGNVVHGQGICVIYGSSNPKICAKK